MGCVLEFTVKYPILRGIDHHTERYLVVEKAEERLPVSKQAR